MHLRRINSGPAVSRMLVSFLVAARRHDVTRASIPGNGAATPRSKDSTTAELPVAPKRRGRPPKKSKLAVAPFLPPVESTMASTLVDPPSPPTPAAVDPSTPVGTHVVEPQSLSAVPTPVIVPPLDTDGNVGALNPFTGDKSDALSFFADMATNSHGGGSGHSLAENTLVYNALTGRMNAEHSLSVQCLREVGFGINPQRQIFVEDPQKLNKLAERVRARTATLPARWPMTLQRTLGGILTNKAITDPAAAVQQLILVKLNSIMRSRYASVVTAAPPDRSGNVELSDSLNVMDNETDPTRAITLNEEQERVVSLALQGHHLYLGGSAGTGKTVLLRVLCRRLQGHRLRVAMTATTGVAGCHIGGSTFHHALGVSANGDFLRRSAMLDYDVIIIDEVSMLPQRLFEGLDRILREEAGTPHLPFGGVQIILCGDFLQLGCINERSIIHSKLFHDNFVSMRLTTQVRQSSETKFAQDLQLMRRGIVPSDLTETIQQLPPGTMVDAAVNLLPTNKEVHAANEKELQQLEGDPLTLSPETGITKLKCDTTATLLLRTQPGFDEEGFCRHVRSMLQATLDLPRASLLSLYRIYEDGHAMRVILPPGESVAWREAMRERFLEVAALLNDLDLGATVTEISPNGDGLHTPENEEYLQKLMAKHPIAQPLTFKKGCRVLLRANLSSHLVNGSIGTVVDFVECKRESFPDYLRNENVEECIERYRVFCFTECGMPIPMVPVVKFHSGETVAVPPWEFTVGGGPSTNYYALSAVSLPLSLAYAFTVHKVQGLTLVGRVHLELSRMWPCEHLLYVAMSRVRNPEQLSMSSFTPSMVVADESCVAFDTRLRAALEVDHHYTSTYPVSSWKCCNDTIYHLRSRGASLRRLLEDVTGHGTVTRQGSSRSLAHVTHGPSTSPGTAAGSPHSSNGELPSHLEAVEQSVLVARRMRKLVKHVERVAKLSEARKRAKTAAIAAESVSTLSVATDSMPIAAAASIMEVAAASSEEFDF